ncbi:MFS transporter [Acidisphaera rubrifaciens]|uniref:Major facilitator superfamily transporter n=1 Tax=Acidisphaera rubrifaciens HS-AP3 TaxID=1231350 RepID=A0A0D6P3E4_9PROT|nr:MFS transporter [Acidisphaera rubrifaciens]GAN76280.1 major facilitator superfamily transporter [Acidisphaera rubrifaciens HS-AP3]
MDRGAPDASPPLPVIACMGVGQIVAWGSSFYLLAVLAGPIARATGWSNGWIVGALSLGLLIAGIGSPRVGHLIERFGGRPVLATSAALLAAGLLMQAVAPSLPVFILAWCVIGLGMSAGLYDPAFATLGRLYGEHARGAITRLTLFGGFASTVCWPLSALFVAHLGWRGACLAFAAINLVVVLPLYWFGVPREAHRPPPPRHAAHAAGRRLSAEDRYALALIAVNFTLAAVIMTVVAVHVLTLMQARGLTLDAAVGLGALIGPAQVGARVLEAVFGRRFHPVWSFLISGLLVTGGLCMLLGPAGVIGAGLVLYGSGSGIRSIVRGTLPLALFGREGYAVLIGWLAMPSLVAQAASPSVGSLLIAHLGSQGTIAVLIAAAVVNALLVLPLLPLVRRRPAHA